ncbi:MAG: hypothetical protein WC001_13590 [Desulfurivibrionaceae bacterium]
MHRDEIVYAIKMKDILSALSKRLGDKEALKLTEEEINLARDEVRAAIDHNLDVRDYIDMGLDAWDITRNL